MSHAFAARSGAASQQTEPVTVKQQPASGSGISGFYNTIAAHRFIFPTMVFLVHFLIVQVAATVAYVYATSNKSSGPYESALGPPKPVTGIWENLVGPLRLWDGLWYKQIAEHLYSFGDANAAFWPLLPWVMRYGHNATGLEYEVVGYLFVNLCFLAALIVLYQLIPIDFSNAIARRTLWGLALFPTSLFFTAVYTEAPFLLFAALCLLCARKGQWGAAGVVGLLAALTRSQGIMLLAPMAVLFLNQYKFNIRKWFPNIFLAALPLLGPVIFGWRLEENGYSWRAFIDVQGQWNRASAMPWKTFECATRGCTLIVDAYGEKAPYRARGDDWTWLHELIRHPSWDLIAGTTWPAGIVHPEFANWRDAVARGDTLELVSTLLFIGLAIVGLFKLPLWMSAFVWPPLLVPLFQPSSVHPLMSMPRFGIVLFPLFIVLAMLLKGTWTRIIASGVSVILLILLTMQFANWYWVS
jgi:hypothetical protein